MNITIRRILLLCSFTAFVVSAPLIVLYAMGYRYTITRNPESAVGVLLAETIPNRANIDVHEVYRGRTPQSIPNLNPGLVPVRITRDGYIPWEKNIEIRPAQATEIRSVRLFPEEPRKQTIDTDISFFALSPNRSLVASVNEDDILRIQHLANGRITPLVTLSDTPHDLTWSPDNSFILIAYDTTYAVIDVSDTASPPTPLPQLQGARNTTWHPRVPGIIFGITDNDELISHTITTSQTERIATNVSAFAPSTRHLIVALQNNTLHAYTLQGSHTRNIPVSLEHPIHTLHVTPAGKVAILYTNNQLVYINEEETITHITSNVLRASWSPNGLMLLVHSQDNALHIYNIADERLYSTPLQELHLVLRLSRPIANPQWYAGGHHVIFQAGDNIVISEIDTRDRPITYTIDTADIDNAHIAVGENGDTVLYLAPKDNTVRLMQAHMLTKQDE